MSEVTGIVEEKIPLPPDVQADFYLSSVRQINTLYFSHCKLQSRGDTN